MPHRDPSLDAQDDMGQTTTGWTTAMPHRDPSLDAQDDMGQTTIGWTTAMPYRDPSLDAQDDMVHRMTWVRRPHVGQSAYRTPARGVPH